MHSNKMTKIKRSSAYRRKKAKNVNRIDTVVFKKPFYQGVKFSANEDKAIEILKKNGFTSTMLGEVLGRKKNSVRNRSIEVNFSDYKPTTYVDFVKNTQNYEKLKHLKGGGKEKEATTNNVIYNELIKRNFQIFKVTREGEKFDLIAYKKQKFFKIQLKTVSFIARSNFYTFGAAMGFFYNRNKKINNKVVTTKKGEYKYKGIDFFIFNCAGTNYFYVIPENKIRNISRNSSLHFYPHRLRVMVRSTFLDTEPYKNNFDIIK